MTWARIFTFIFVLLSQSSFTGCQVTCNPIAYAAVSATIYDAATGNPLCGVSAEVITDRDSFSYIVPERTDCQSSSINHYGGVGTYQLVVTKEGYKTFASDDLVATSEDGCVIEAQRIDVYLEKVDAV